VHLALANEGDLRRPVPHVCWGCNAISIAAWTSDVYCAKLFDRDHVLSADYTPRVFGSGLGLPGVCLSLVNLSSCIQVLMLISYSTSWTSGSPPHYVTDAFDLLSNFDDLSRFLSPNIFWIQEFDKVFTRANIKLTELAYSDTLSSTKETFRDLIKHFDDEILQMSRKAVRNTNPQYSEPAELSCFATPLPMIITAFRIHINAFHFLASDITLHVPQFIELYYLACYWTQNASDADETNSWALYSSEPYFRHMFLVATIILRISRSPLLKSKVDLSKGEGAYYALVNMLKKRSLLTDDSNTHMANILSEIWRSDDCFMLPDGSYDSLLIQKSGRGVSIQGNKYLWFFH
jgi:hypothetical protein